MKEKKIRNKNSITKANRCVARENITSKWIELHLVIMLRVGGHKQEVWLVRSGHRHQAWEGKKNLKGQDPSFTKLVTVANRLGGPLSARVERVNSQQTCVQDNRERGGARRFWTERDGVRKYQNKRDEKEKYYWSREMQTGSENRKTKWRMGRERDLQTIYREQHRCLRI